MKEMRVTYVESLIELAEKDARVVALDADLMAASKAMLFQARFPERFFNAGVAEANMIGMSAGLSETGLIPFAHTFAPFATRKTLDQIHVSSNYAHLPIKVVGSDPGINAEMNGGTHMSFEDVGLMRVLPGMTVVEPCDHVSLKGLMEQIKDLPSTVYLRLTRKGAPDYYTEGEKFELGKAKVVREGTDAVVFTSGSVCMGEALKAHDELKVKGISCAVIDVHTIKPLDEKTILEWAKKTGAVVTFENHQIIGGLGSAVAETLSEHFPCLMKRLGIQGVFGAVGKLDYLKKRYGILSENVVQAVQEVISKKKTQV